MQYAQSLTRGYFEQYRDCILIAVTEGHASLHVRDTGMHVAIYTYNSIVA